MKTDRELLEQAAKAAGMQGLWFANDAPDSPMFFHQPGRSVYGRWNPLTDDGDSLRLAVKCDIDVIQLGNQARADYMIGIGYFTVDEPYGDDPCAATRRAIVRAAAASIGEQT